MIKPFLIRLLPFLLIGVLLGCQDKQATPTETDDELVVSVVNGKFTSNLKSDDLMRFSQRILTKDAESNPAFKGNSLLKNGKVTESRVELSGAYYYLISQVKNAETGKYLYSSAIELAKNPTDEQSASLRIGDDDEAVNNRPGVEKHTCTGNPCTGCSFAKNKYGQITGCLCSNTANGYMCNHTVTTG